MAAGAGADSEATGPAPIAAFYLLLVLSLATLATSLGRGVLALLVGPIGKDLGFTDGEIGLLFGFTFIAIYALISLPVARLIDRGPRRTLIGAGLALWSLGSMAAALAGGFLGLLFTRIAAGAGEAAVGPASFSILADRHPRARLSRAIAYTSIGGIIGSGLAIAGGGLLLAALGWLPMLSLPLLGEIHGWQAALILAGLPGLGLALLALTLPEPPRTGPVPSTDDVARHLVTKGPAYAPVIAAITLLSMLAYGQAAWLPTFAMRAYGWSAADCGLILGAILLTAGPLGALYGGRIVTRLALRGRRDAEMRVTLWSALLATPAAILMPLMPSADLAVALGALFWFGISMAVGPQAAAIQLLAPPRMRARVTAVALFAFNVIGVGLGPMIVPLLGQDAMIGPALALFAAIFGPLAILAGWLSLKPYAAAVEGT